MNRKDGEGLVGVVILAVAAALALMLSGCDDGDPGAPTSAYPDHESGFRECEKPCGGRPAAVQWDHHGCLLGCRCDLVISTDTEVE